MRHRNALGARSRRTFVKETALGAAALAALPSLTAAPSPAKAVVTKIPPHRPLYVAGIHGYADRESVAPGQTIRFHVSADQPHRMEIARLGLDPNSPAGDQVIEAFTPSAGWFQPIHPGSYIHVARRLSGSPSALTFECWVRPWKLRALGGVITQWDSAEDAGIGLFLTPQFQPLLQIGPLAVTGNLALKPNVWAHLAVVVGQGVARALVDGKEAARLNFDGRLKLPAVPLRIGAAGTKGEADHFLDADIAMPAVYSRALSDDELRQRVETRGLAAPKEGVIGCWPLDEERGSRARDVSRQARHGTIINHGTWMIGGPSYNSEAPRFEDYAPEKDPQRGHGLRLASDDLYDCRWAATQSWKVPPDAPPGIYVARIHFAKEQPHLYHITFIVRPGPRSKPAPILVLCATNTWRAYNATPFCRNQPGLRHIAGTNGMANSEGEPPAFSFYRTHAAGQGTFQMGLRVPWPAAGPYIRYGDQTDYSHLARAERFTHIWLEKAGYDFDVVSDTDLHLDPGLLKRYTAVVINGHSEYWSAPMYRGLESYLAQGGKVVCLSGNSLFWRVSYDEEMTVLECRKVDAPGDQLPPSRRGECWHSTDGARGGLLRECGLPGWKLVGLETLGWNDQNDPRQFGPYTVENPEHFLFTTPRNLQLKRGDKFGEAPDGSLPRANGHEIDVRLSTLQRLQQTPPPAGAIHPGDPAGMSLLANGIIPWKIGGAAFDYFFRAIKPQTDQGGEVIFWERPEGGKVFNAGSIGSGWALWADPRFQGLMQNVLSHYGVEPRGSQP